MLVGYEYRDPASRAQTDRATHTARDFESVLGVCDALQYPVRQQYAIQRGAVPRGFVRALGSPGGAARAAAAAAADLLLGIEPCGLGNAARSAATAASGGDIRRYVLPGNESLRAYMSLVIPGSLAEARDGG